MLLSAAHPIWTLSEDAVLTATGSSRQGLSSAEAQQRLEHFGANTLPPPQQRSLVLRLGDQLLHPMALLLWVAGTLALLAGTRQLAVAIWAVVLINGGFSFWQEYQAERTMAALVRALPRRVQLWRDGTLVQRPAESVVPGDCLQVEAGDQVPADCRLIEAQALSVDLSMLTGESLPAARHAEALEQPLLLARERANLLLAGTTVAAGRGTAIVYATGSDTEFGHVARLSVLTRRSPSTLEQEVAQIVRTITTLALALGAAIFLLSYWLVGMGGQESLILAIGIIVANVPEGLLPTVTLALAINVQRMARRQALVRRLSAVETLGSLSVICSDKTGTLTEGRMVLEQIWLPRPDATNREQALRWACLCSNARLERRNTGPEASWLGIGDSTETALLQAALAAGIAPDQARQQNPRLLEVPFDSHRRRMSVVVNSGEGPLLISKGAPSEVLQQCRATGDDERLRVQAAADVLAARGLRVLALAVRPLAPDWSSQKGPALEQDLHLVALLGLYDPPRPEVPAAIAACRDAGIKVTMVTGDSGLTAQAIASQIGLLDQPAGSADRPAADPVRVIEGDALDHLSPVQLRLLLRHRQRLVFARMAPEQKLRLVEAYRSLGEVVAVTGDGVNDAPSLRAADVGIAMGRSGTDVAREAADIVLLDDNFATIVEAVRHGRAVVANISRFLTYVLASNVAEMAPFVAMVTLQVPPALSVLQILAVDLGTDLLPALGLGAEPPEPGVMRRPPRNRQAPLLNRAVLLRAYLVLGLVEALVSMGGYLLVLPHNQQQASTLTFVLIVAGQMGALLACRSSIRPFWQLLSKANPLFWAGLLSEPLIAALLVLVPPVAAVFGMEPMPRQWLGWIALAPLAVLLADSLHKQLNQTASVVSSRFNSANR